MKVDATVSIPSSTSVLLVPFKTPFSDWKSEEIGDLYVLPSLSLNRDCELLIPASSDRLRKHFVPDNAVEKILATDKYSLHMLSDDDLVEFGIVPVQLRSHILTVIGVVRTEWEWRVVMQREAGRGSRNEESDSAREEGESEL